MSHLAGSWRDDSEINARARVVRSPTAGPTRPNQATLDILVANSFDGGSSVKNATTEQYWAADFLLNDPLVSTYSNERLLQRYAFLTLFRIIDLRRGQYTSLWQGLNLTDECVARGIDCNADARFEGPEMGRFR